MCTIPHILTTTVCTVAACRCMSGGGSCETYDGSNNEYY